MPDEPNKEQEELENLLNQPVEGEGEEENDDANKGGEGSDDEKDKDKGEENDESGKDTKIKPTPPEGTDEGKEGDEDGKPPKKDRWEGKSREEVIAEHEKLEQKIKDEKTKKGKKKDGEEAEGDDDKKTEVEVPSAEELQKMSPSDFAKWVLGKISEGVKTTLESQEKVRTAVRQEISTAKKEHPLHVPEYRELVLNIIQAASAKGVTIPLKDACQKVDAYLGKIKPKDKKPDELSDEEKSRLKKAKAQVESGAGAPTKPDGSDAETKRIQKALGGSGQTSPLGGLGV